MDGVCRFNEKRLSISGIFGQSITLAELISDWVGSFVKVSPNIGRHRKDVLYTGDFEERLWRKGTCHRHLRPLLSDILIIFAKTVKDNYFNWCSKETASLKEKVSQLQDGEEEGKANLEGKINTIARVRATVIQFLNLLTPHSFIPRL